jgi:hypothetical protein
MILAIGVDNLMASTETASTALTDFIDKSRIVKRALIKSSEFLPKFIFTDKPGELKKYVIVGGLCILFFCCGLLFCTNAGIYWVRFRPLTCIEKKFIKYKNSIILDRFFRQFYWM